MNETIKTESATELIDYRYKIVNATELCTMPLPDIEWILYPFIQAKGIALLYAERGVGKTFMALAIACAAASGFDFLNFKARQTKYRVLYIDGEMAAKDIQDRLNRLVAGFATEDKHVDTENIDFFCADLQTNDIGMPNLSSTDGQLALEPYLQDKDLIILDNVYFLYKPDKENDADSWQAFNTWSQSQRSKGRSILWIHHTGKDKARGPRGSSAIETILNTSLSMENDDNHKQSHGAIVHMEYTKSRGVAGDAVKDIHAKLDKVGQNGLKWVCTKNAKTQEVDMVKKLQAEGKTLREIEKMTKIPKSTVHRMAQNT